MLVTGLIYTFVLFVYAESVGGVIHTINISVLVFLLFIISVSLIFAIRSIIKKKNLLTAGIVIVFDLVLLLLALMAFTGIDP